MKKLFSDKIYLILQIASVAVGGIYLFCTRSYQQTLGQLASLDGFVCQRHPVQRRQKKMGGHRCQSGCRHPAVFELDDFTVQHLEKQNHDKSMVSKASQRQNSAAKAVCFRCAVLFYTHYRSKIICP